MKEKQKHYTRTMCKVEFVLSLYGKTVGVPQRLLENHILFGEIGAAAGRGAILQHPHGVKCLRNGHNRNTQSEGRVQGNFVHLQEYK